MPDLPYRAPTTIDLASDNVAGVSPEILAALGRAAAGTAGPYGADAETRRLEALLTALFETELAVFPVANGTGANAIALAAATRSYEAVACTDCAHVLTSECGAPEFFSGGAKLHPIETVDGRMRAEALDAAITEGRGHGVHQSQIASVSVTQATEWGTVYAVDEVAAISAVAHRHGCHVHMDGARFANALVTLGVSPADATWRAGIDILSFGATKNGAIAAEAILVFQPELARGIAARRKQSGHLWSKQRFLSAQLVGYLEDGLWLRNASRANDAARRLGRGLAALDGVSLRHQVAANEVFARVPHGLAEAMAGAGVGFYRWIEETTHVTLRMVTSFVTTDAEVDAVVAAAGASGRLTT